MAILILKLTEYTPKYENESGRLTHGGANGCMQRYSKICKKHLRSDIIRTIGRFDTLILCTLACVNDITDSLKSCSKICDIAGEYQPSGTKTQK